MTKNQKRIKELEAQVAILSLNPNQSGWLLVQSMQAGRYPLDKDKEPVTHTAERYPKWLADKVAKVPNWETL